MVVSTSLLFQIASIERIARALANMLGSLMNGLPGSAYDEKTMARTRFEV